MPATQKADDYIFPRAVIILPLILIGLLGYFKVYRDDSILIYSSNLSSRCPYLELMPEDQFHQMYNDTNNACYGSVCFYEDINFVLEWRRRKECYYSSDLEVAHRILKIEHENLIKEALEKERALIDLEQTNIQQDLTIIELKRINILQESDLKTLKKTNATQELTILKLELSNIKYENTIMELQKSYAELEYCLEHPFKCDKY